MRQYSSESGDLHVPSDTNYLLSCLNDMQDIGPEEFAANFEMAENGLQRGRDQDKLRFICLSLHAGADYQQFKEGTKVLEQYIVEHPNTPDDIQGFQILVNQLDVEMMTKQYSSESGDLHVPSDTNYLLSCLNDMQDIGPEEFAANFEMAENGLQRGRDQDKLRFICLSLHAGADYQQFKEGTKVLEQYIVEHPNTPDDIQGFQILVNQLDVEMMTKWSAWKSLLEDKKELMAEIEELQKQIEQLKNIENIIKSRETEKP